MAGKNLTPRQKMINLMYLVLLALLAMQASKDLLNAFFRLDQGINVTNDNLNDNNLAVLRKIQNAAALGSTKAVNALKTANEIIEASDSLKSSLTNHKNAIIEMGGGVDEETGIPKGKDNQDVAAEYMLFNKNGAALKKQINEFEQTLISHIDKQDSSLIESVHNLLQTPNFIDYEGNESPWEAGISENLPLIAATANLSTLETYISNAERQVLNYLHEGIAADSYKVNRILATTTSEKNYILQGDEYNAKIFLAASDTTQEPIILIGEYDSLLYTQTGEIKFLGEVDSIPVRGGVGEFHTLAEETGTHEWKGVMKVPHPNPKRKGDYLMYPFAGSYTVAAPSAVISSEKLNIMYLGLDNEINVSAPGISADKIEVSASKGCVSRKTGDGKFALTPKRTGKTTISVYLNENGNRKLLSSQNWVAKRLPKPRMTLFKKELKAVTSKGLFTHPKAKGFETSYSPDFPLSGKLKIEECFVTVEVKGNWMPAVKLTNGKFNSKFLNLVKNQRKGERIEVRMKVRGQDNIPHPVLAFTKIK